MGLFSALLGNAGSVSQESLTKDYAQLLTNNEEIEIFITKSNHLRPIRT